MPTLPKVATPRIPPTPLFVVMTDRADGKLWVLSHDVTGNYIAINDQGLLKGGDLPTVEWSDRRIYGPYEGPYVEVPVRLNKPFLMLRLLVRGGYLGYEEVELPDGVSRHNARILTRRGLSRVFREIIVPQGWQKFNSPTDILGWEDNPVVT